MKFRTAMTDGSLSDLLGLLDHYKPAGEAWPKTPKGLGDSLRRLAPGLRQIGIECKSAPKSHGLIRWTICFSCNGRLTPSHPSHPRPPIRHDPPLGGGHGGHGLGRYPLEKTGSEHLADADTEVEL